MVMLPDASIEMDMVDLLRLMPTLQALLLYDTTLFAIGDARCMQYVYYHPAKDLDLAKGGTLVGVPLVDGQVTYEAIRQQRFVVQSKSEADSVFGVGYKSASCPIRFNGEVIGALSAIVSLGTASRVSQKAKMLETVSGELRHAATELKRHLSSVMNGATKLGEILGRYHREVDSIAKVSSIIHDITERTKILGLNASMQAGRAGAAGLGFAVVSKEVRELAIGAKKEASRIDVTTRGLQQEFLALADVLQHLNHSIQALEAEELRVDTLSGSTRDVATALQEAIQFHFTERF